MKIEMYALVLSYAKKIYVIWNQCDYFDKYELYRDGVLIGETREKDFGPFKRPTVFDTDHHTNLFRKKSSGQLMYEDEDIKSFVEYEYEIKAYRKDTVENKKIHVIMS